jgi:hypothetical protein
MPSDQSEGAPDVAGCAYLLLSHKDPDKVEALAQRILTLSPSAHVVVHHDLTGGPAPWAGGPPARVHLVERTNVEWGGWSIVEATLRMIRFAQEQLHSRWMVVISGEHWPVTDLAAWEAKVVASGADALMPTEVLPPRLRFGTRDPDANRDLARCRLRWFRVRRPRSAAVQKAVAALSKLSDRTHPVFKLEFSLRNESWFVGVPRRSGPVRGWDLYKGSEWVAFNARSAAVLLQADPRVTSWFEHSHIPDESYFQTLVHRDGRLSVDRSVVTWVPPQPPTPTHGWMLLKDEELPLVSASGAAFARKLDPDRNPEVLAAIDARVDAERSVPNARRHGGEARSR